jgi:hypothetical protein
MNRPAGLPWPAVRTPPVELVGGMRKDSVRKGLRPFRVLFISIEGDRECHMTLARSIYQCTARGARRALAHLWRPEARAVARDVSRADRTSRHRMRALASASPFAPPPAHRLPSLPPGP